MPRENRKRGKKHKKKAEGETGTEPNPEHPPSEPQAGPSWIIPPSNAGTTNQEAPFGYVDAEVKAYFRTVDTQIREWQEEGFQRAEVAADVDPNEGIPNWFSYLCSSQLSNDKDRRLFFVAALTEMSGKEKELATDPDCSSILERMSYSMDDFVRRVFLDRLTGSYVSLLFSATIALFN